MITEDHLEQLALTWFQDSGWECCYGPDIAPGSSALRRRETAMLARLLDILKGDA